MQKLLGHLLVILQFAGIGYCSYLAWLTMPPVNPFFLLIAGAGVVFGLITLRYNKIGNFNVHPHPRNQASLITTGPYKFIRHPMYLSVLISLAGASLQADHPHAWISLFLAALAMVWKSFIEERLLTQKFPEYNTYKTRTKRLIPFLF